MASTPVLATAGGEAMANEEQVKRLKQSVQEWNEWRDANRLTPIDLSGAILSRAILSGANLTAANLTGADLESAILSRANLTGAFLFRAFLQRANLTGANLTGANLTGANLTGTDLTDANLNGANLIEATLWNTVFGNVDLTGVTGLEQCIHYGPSTIDHRTLQQSGPLPLAFLRGVGLPDNLIEYLPSLLSQAIQHYSCFISYSNKDDEFARRIHADK
jgi:uncharacterized protein YjbI with pentapeptide repeats